MSTLWTAPFLSCAVPMLLRGMALRAACAFALAEAAPTSVRGASPSPKATPDAANTAAPIATTSAGVCRTRRMPRWRRCSSSRTDIDGGPFGFAGCERIPGLARDACAEHVSTGSACELIDVGPRAVWLRAWVGERLPATADQDLQLHQLPRRNVAAAKGARQPHSVAPADGTAAAVDRG